MARGVAVRRRCSALARHTLRAPVRSASTSMVQEIHMQSGAEERCPGRKLSDDPVQEPYAVSVAWLRGEVWWKRSTVLRQRTASGARGGSGWSLA